MISTRHLRDIEAIDPIIDSVKLVSVYKNKVLIKLVSIEQLLIYFSDGRFVSEVTPINPIYHASWTPKGNIAYTSLQNESVTVTSEDGKVISNSRMASPMFLSISNGVIYVATLGTGVHQSIDEGTSWRLVFKSVIGWSCFHAIRVINKSGTDDFWSLESKPPGYAKFQLMMYRVLNDNVTNRIVSLKRNYLAEVGNKLLTLSPSSSLSFDGEMCLFIIDNVSKTIRALPLNGRSPYQLISSNDMKSNPCSLAVDTKRHELYVGQQNSLVSVFNLTYE